MWAFNDERVAHAIYASNIPVISAVGHEPDVTICDYVADLRAATPSNGAELAVPDQNALRQNLDAMSQAMAQAMDRKVRNARLCLDGLAQRPVLTSPTRYFEQRAKALELLKNRLLSAQNHTTQIHHRRFVALTSKLDAMSPLKVLVRGYALASDEDGNVIRSAGQVRSGQKISVRVSDGTIQANVIEGVKDHE